jgi:hypothetical protein
VWLYSDNKQVRIGPPLDIALVLDARRYGQDLVDELIDEAMRVSERGKNG